MKRISLLLLLMVSLMVHSFAQAQRADSLVNVLKTQKMTPSKEMESYLELYKLLVQSDIEAAAAYVQKGLQLAEKQNDELMASIFNEQMGIIQSRKSAYDIALDYLNKALKIAQSLNNKDREASVYSKIGDLYARQTEHQLALEYYTKSLSITEGMDEQELYLENLVSIGGLYYRIGNIDQATTALEKALEISERLNQPERKLRVFYQLSVIYSGEGEVEKAIEYQQAIIDYSRATNNKVFEIAGYDSMAETYLYDIKDYDKALIYAEKCMVIAKEYGDSMIIAGIWKLLSNVYRYQKNYKECELAASNAWAIDSTDLDIAYNLAFNLAFSNAFLGDVTKAEYFTHKYAALAHDRHDKTNKEALAEIQVKYETEKRELQIAALEKEKQLYTWIGIAGFLFATSLGIILFLNIVNAKKVKQLIATRSVMDGEMRERIRLAKDLHDRLSGNLLSVKMELSNAKSIESLNIGNKLDSCIEEVRRVAHDLMPASLRYGLKVALEDFAAQFPNVHFHFFGKESRIEERVEYVLYCCANELINNSQRHSGAKNINLQLIQNGKYISLIVQDDGAGYDEKIVKRGLGLKNIYDRVAACNGRVNVTSSPERGTETVIELSKAK